MRPYTVSQADTEHDQWPQFYHHYQSHHHHHDHHKENCLPSCNLCQECFQNINTSSNNSSNVEKCWVCNINYHNQGHDGQGVNNINAMGDLVNGWQKNNKTISDGGITVDFSIFKVHTSNCSSNSWISSNSLGSSNTWGSLNSCCWDHRIVGDHQIPLDL